MFSHRCVFLQLRIQVRFNRMNHAMYSLNVSILQKKIKHRGSNSGLISGISKLWEAFRKKQKHFNLSSNDIFFHLSPKRTCLEHKIDS